MSRRALGSGSIKRLKRDELAACVFDPSGGQRITQDSASLVLEGVRHITPLFDWDYEHMLVNETRDYEVSWSVGARAWTPVEAQVWLEQCHEGGWAEVAGTRSLLGLPKSTIAGSTSGQIVLCARRHDLFRLRVWLAYGTEAWTVAHASRFTLREL